MRKAAIGKVSQLLNTLRKQKKAVSHVVDGYGNEWKHKPAKDKAKQLDIEQIIHEEWNKK